MSVIIQARIKIKKPNDFHNGEGVYIINAENYGLNSDVKYYLWVSWGPDVEYSYFLLYYNMNGDPPNIYPGDPVLIEVEDEDQYKDEIASIIIRQSPKIEYHVKIDHDITDSYIDREYDLSIVKTDYNGDYGSNVSFFYNWNDPVTKKSILIKYPDFFAYPDGWKTDVYRNRKRYISYIN